MEENNSSSFWVRGIGLSTYKSKFNRETFSLDDLWDLAKQVEKCEDKEELRGCFLPQYEIPFFTDHWVMNVERAFDVLCAMVGENRMRILVEPLPDTEGGKQLLWCRDNNVPLYCFATGKVPKNANGRIFLRNFNIVLNKSSCTTTMAETYDTTEDDNEEGKFCERDVLITYPVPEEYEFFTCKIGVWTDSNETAIDLANKFFFNANSFFRDRDHIAYYKEL